MSNSTTNTEAELREQLAAIEHERWADWQKYMHSVGEVHIIDGKAFLCFTQERINAWNKQIETPYSELSEKEKDSDREQVDRYWPLIQEETRKAKVDELENLNSHYWGTDDNDDLFDVIAGEYIGDRIKELEADKEVKR